MPNLITLTGPLASTLDMTYFETGKIVGKTSIYIRSWDPNLKQTVSSRFKLEFWDNVAEQANAFCSKGKTMTVTGSLHLNEFTAASGQKVEYYVVKVNKFDPYSTGIIAQTGMISNLQSDDNYYTFTLSSPNIKVKTNKMVPLENGMVISLAGSVNRINPNEPPEVYATYLEVIK